MSTFTDEVAADLIKVGNWLKKEVGIVEDKVAPMAVTVIEVTQKVLATGVPNAIAVIGDELLKTGMLETIVAKVTNALPVLLGISLTVAGAATATTDEEKQALVESILAAFGVLNDKSKLYTNVGVDVEDIIAAETGITTKYTFFQLAAKLEDAYQSMKGALAAPAIAADVVVELGKAAAEDAVN